jgi:hypothetical protein
MKFACVYLLSMAAAFAGACRPCEKITAWKLYRSGTPKDWPVRDNSTLPGYFERIKNGTKHCASLTNTLQWNIMMFTEPTYKDGLCCGDTDGVPKDFLDLCGVVRLYQEVPADSGTFVQRGPQLTELFWPWFLNGDNQCSPADFHDGEASFDPTIHCNPSERIFPATGYNPANTNLRAGAGALPVGKYKLIGSTHNGCPTPRATSQIDPPAGPALDTSVVTFYIKAGC